MVDTNQNPMVGISTTLTGSIFFSAPTEVLEILWTDISASCSLTLCDMDDNRVFHGIAEGTQRVIEDPRVFANGLKISTQASTGLEDGTLFVWVR